MEAKKCSFCPTCGAALLGEETFCGSCGAKLPAAVHAAPAPEVAAAPAAEPAVGTAPVTAPANALAPKAKPSVLGLIMSVMALGATLIAVILTVAALAWSLGTNVSTEVGIAFLTQSFTRSLTAWIAPLAALVLVLVKKKKLAVVGIILGGLSLMLQFLFAILYVAVVSNGSAFTALSPLLRLFNGVGLFFQARELIRFIGIGKMPPHILMNVFAALLYFAKNILAAIACLAVVIKRKK